MKMYPGARLIVGNTELDIETRFRKKEFLVLVNPTTIREFNVLKLCKLDVCT